MLTQDIQQICYYLIFLISHLYVNCHDTVQKSYLEGAL
jgi:hypothetical protein